MSDPAPHAPHAPAGSTREAPAPVTLRTLNRMASRAERFACLTCYDATTARWLERAGVHLLLVGDTAAEVILGLPGTVHMPLELSLALTAAVRRGAPRTVVMGDMPFMSYHADESEAIRNAGRFITEGLADVVKIEADASFAPLAARMARAGVPVCGHVGSRPQRAGMTGGYSSSGRTAEEARRIVTDAIALEEAGCVMLLIEAAPPEVTRQIVERSRVPVIGIGAGPACHGEILVLQDLVGMTDWQPPFAEPVAMLGEAIRAAAEQWVARVREGAVTSHRYRMKPGESERLAAPKADGRTGAEPAASAAPGARGGTG